MELISLKIKKVSPIIRKEHPICPEAMMIEKEANMKRVHLVRSTKFLFIFVPWWVSSSCTVGEGGCWRVLD
jgi:hypothetical protein